MRLVDADALAHDLEHDVELCARALDDMNMVGKEREDMQFQKDCKQNCIWYISEQPTVDAIPIEYIQKEIEELEESLDFYGSIGEYDALRIDAMYQHDALTGLLRRWKAERKDNE